MVTLRQSTSTQGLNALWAMNVALQRWRAEMISKGIMSEIGKYLGHFSPCRFQAHLAVAMFQPEREHLLGVLATTANGMTNKLIEEMFMTSAGVSLWAWVQRRLTVFSAFASVAFFCISIPAQSNPAQTQAPQPIPLTIKAPQGWHIEPAKGDVPTKMFHDTDPKYVLSVGPAVASGSCARRLEILEKPLFPPQPGVQRPNITRGPRPGFAPDSYAPLSGFTPGGVLLCMDLGSRTVFVGAMTLGGARDSTIRPGLDAVAQAALPLADYVSGPGRARLPKLEIEIKLESGQYIVQPLMVNGRPRDTIVRLNSEIPLEITFFEFKPADAGGCSELFNPSFHTRTRTDSPFVSKRWYPRSVLLGAWGAEQGDSDETCIVVSPQLMLLALLNYGKADVSAEESKFIREFLDRVADAVAQGPHTTGQISETFADFANNGRGTGGVIGGIIGGSSATPPTAVNGPSPGHVLVSKFVSGGLLTKKVEPAYPQLARQARIQGAVLLQALINKDGTIENLQLISGHPMLTPAAIEAVKQWIYKPYVLNGVPVAVETQVEVNFQLSDNPSRVPAGSSSGASRTDAPK